jgi:hypothetical protein
MKRALACLAFTGGLVAIMTVALGCVDDDGAPRARDVLASSRAPGASGVPAAKREAIFVKPRKDQIDGYPCHECHDESMAPDNTERVLKESHGDVQLAHGGGRFWCTTCHGTTFDKDALVSLNGTRIDFDASYVLCGQCHFEKERDFLNGAHGKRLDTWRGEPRTVAACTTCHDAHDPAIKPRKPWRGPDAIR